ncbi:MAG: ribonuclease HI [Deltaproteobacteria bacterium]|nr:ribonuclease HI [Deltaproteobacteria bacterium]
MPNERDLRARSARPSASELRGRKLHAAQPREGGGRVPLGDSPAPLSFDKFVRLYTDGSCHGNPGPGGWAAILDHRGHRRELTGAEAATTNNRMELRAVIEGLRALTEPCEVEVWTDSRYVVDGMKSWLAAWKARGWKTAGKQPVKNEDLWRALDAEAARHRVTWHWVRGHDGHVENERADTLANAAIASLD